ncbi:MAG: alpha/beta hydrolase [Alphaproteobacteria bacterium]|nr:alpha/beta hydrolase [Alphaproteobacteria bacterium]
MSTKDSTSVQVRLDVPYGGGPLEDLCLDIYLPAGAGPHPALLCLHGGAWHHGSHRQYQSWGPWLAERGFGVVAVDYRLTRDVSPAWPGVWEDVCLSLDWLIANASSLGIDTARIGAIGDSAGAHMAAMLSLAERTAPHIRAVVGVYGVYDLPAWWRVTTPPHRSEDPVRALMGGAYEEMKAAYEDFSPMHRLRELAGPPAAKYLLVYGDQDPRVPHIQSERFLAALRDKGASVEAIPIPGAGHSWFTFVEGDPTRRRVDEAPNATLAPRILEFLRQTVSS